jgi:L-arabonate dehydrase
VGQREGRALAQPGSDPRLGPAAGADGSIRILRGNLAPRGAVLKPSAATARLLKHRGRAVVFEDLDDYKARIADPELEVTSNRSWC